MDEGCDYILIETMNNARESVAAAEVAQKVAPGRWGICFSLPSETVGIQRCGTPIADIIDKLKDAAFIGVNCVDAKEMEKQVKHLKKIVPEDMKIMAYGNVGFWAPMKDYKAGIKQANTKDNNEIYADCVVDWVKAGATIVGGCCGVSPASLALMTSRVKS